MIIHEDASLKGKGHSSALKFRNDEVEISQGLTNEYNNHIPMASVTFKKIDFCFSSASSVFVSLVNAVLSPNSGYAISHVWEYVRHRIDLSVVCEIVASAKKFAFQDGSEHRAKVIREALGLE